MGWDCHVHVFDEAAPVLGGHYRPAHHPLDAIEQIAAQHGVGHLVLVQPSVYGRDNTVMLRALEASAGRHRGVAVIDASITDSELDRMHAAGVRGIRFNLVSPAGRAIDPESELQALAPRLRDRGWHVQWYVHAHALPPLVRLQADSGLPFVLDHLGGLRADLADDDAAWDAAKALAEGGASVKLSGWYRLGAEAPYDVLHTVIGRVSDLFAQRVVWGSDWPHTGLATAQCPTYESTLVPLRAALSAATAQSVVCQHAQALYVASARRNKPLHL